jgi:hypothetical protein
MYWIEALKLRTLSSQDPTVEEFVEEGGDLL